MLAEILEDKCVLVALMFENVHKNMRKRNVALPRGSEGRRQGWLFHTCDNQDQNSAQRMLASSPRVRFGMVSKSNYSNQATDYRRKLKMLRSYTTLISQEKYSQPIFTIWLLSPV